MKRFESFITDLSSNRSEDAEYHEVIIHIYKHNRIIIKSNIFHLATFSSDNDRLTTSERFTGIFGRASLTTAIIVSPIPAFLISHLIHGYTTF
jgi:hypothetical protein